MFEKQGSGITDAYSPPLNKEGSEVYRFGGTPKACMDISRWYARAL